jgi:hypothetical protein
MFNFVSIGLLVGTLFSVHDIVDILKEIEEVADINRWIAER